MPGLYDLFDSLFIQVLECTTDDLDNFAEKATREELDKFIDLVFEKGDDGVSEEGKLLLKTVIERV